MNKRRAQSKRTKRRRKIKKGGETIEPLWTTLIVSPPQFNSTH